ncbi:MAG: Gfo/Idh/MocA family oxidoreductase [Planctomycetes bacterium]|nr:Gfo/Idh/MocA family oxidoreductase [Planctomycetota bacterium]
MRRRDFLRRSLAAAIAAPAVLPSGVLAAPGRPGPNDRVLVGLIGAGHRARGVFKDTPAALKLVSIGDCDLRQIASFSEWVLKERPDVAQGKPTAHQDYRRMLEAEKLDGVFVETTTHSRTLICIHAMQAGLDVYAEKPLTLTIEEGQHLVRAERRYQRVFQVGTQQRSIPINNFASDLVKGGAIGRVHTVLCMNFLGPERRAPGAGQPAPEGLDWDQWCHQGELVPYAPDLHPGLDKWGRWRDYDGGGLGYGVTGWGTHAFDQVQRALGTDDTTPVEVWPEGRGLECEVSMRYANGTVLKGNLPRDNDKAPGLGGIFIGEKGRIEINRNRVVSDPPEIAKGSPEPDDPSTTASVTRRHIEDWLECMRTRKLPRASALVGHHSTVICHLINICRELGRKLRWDPVKEEFQGDEEANRLRSRPRRKGYELPGVAS